MTRKKYISLSGWIDRPTRPTVDPLASRSPLLSRAFRTLVFLSWPRPPTDPPRCKISFIFVRYLLRSSRSCWSIGWKAIIDKNRGAKAKGQYVSRALFGTHRRSRNEFLSFLPDPTSPISSLSSLSIRREQGQRERRNSKIRLHCVSVLFRFQRGPPFCSYPNPPFSFDLDPPFLSHCTRFDRYFSVFAMFRS